MKTLIAILSLSLALLPGCSMMSTLESWKNDIFQTQGEPVAKSPAAMSPKPRSAPSAAVARNGKESAEEPSKAVILMVQQRLKSAGYDPGPVDGVLGPQTKAALRRYKTVMRLPADSEIDDATLKALGVE